MVLNDYRRDVDKYLTPMARRLPNVDPNLITWLSLIFAFLGGFYIVSARGDTIPVPGRDGFLMIAAACIFINSYLDALDGKVAKLHGKTTRRGDFLDHAGDRYADLFILVGITFSYFCRPWIGIFAIIGVLMTSYMGTQAQALGIGRNYGGILGRADRMVILTFTPVVQYVFIKIFNQTWYFGFTIFEYVMLWFAIAGNFTAVHRAWKAWQELD